MDTIRCAKATNPDYWIVIKSKANGSPVTVVVDMPETMSTNMSSEWESRLPYNILASFLGTGVAAAGAGAAVGTIASKAGLSQGASGALAGAAGAITGYAAPMVADALGANGIEQTLSYQMWTDSSPIELNLSVLLDAEESAYRDVWRPLMLLSGLVLPVGGNINGGVGGIFAGDSYLKAPGPLMGNPDSEGAVQVFIGKQLALLDCIMVTGAPQWDSQLAPDGYPIRGQLDVTFRTARIYGRADLMRFSGVVG